MAVLFIAPLQQELELFTHSLQMYGHPATSIPIGLLDLLHFPTLNLSVARGGHGKTQFGVQTQYLLDHIPNITAVVCVGAAGALAADLAIGDLVLATETIEHDYTQRFRPHPLPRFAADADLLLSVRQLQLHALPFQVHVGIVASGDEDVIEFERAAALRQATEACAVAWEGAGGARACRFNQIAFLELRAITDTADHNAPGDFAANLQIAMANAAALVNLWRGQETGDFI